MTTVKLKRGVPICGMSVPQKGAMGHTGDWRTEKPEKDDEKCNLCGLCVTFCPEGCIEPKTITIDMDYCKGCGVCAEECPVEAITMGRETL